MDFGGIFTTGIDQVEILRGPNSVLYGSDALAGVVNLTTLQGSTFTPQLSYAFDAGNFNSLHNDLSFGGIFRQIDYFSEFARYDGGNTSSNPQFPQWHLCRKLWLVARRFHQPAPDGTSSGSKGGCSQRN